MHKERKKRKKESGWGDVQFVKGLLHRHEDPSSVPNTHIEGRFHDVDGQS